jgi:hypothetical protein
MQATATFDRFVFMNDCDHSRLQQCCVFLSAAAFQAERKISGSTESYLSEKLFQTARPAAAPEAHAH